MPTFIIFFLKFMEGISLSSIMSQSYRPENDLSISKLSNFFGAQDSEVALLLSFFRSSIPTAR